MAKHSHTEALVAVGGVGLAFAGYELLYKPWKLKQDALNLPALPTPFVPAPTGVGPSPIVNPGAYQGSIIDPRVTPGGDVGQAMYRKNWDQKTAQTRLDALKAAFATASNAISTLKSQVVNPAAAGIAAAQLAAQQNDAAAANAVAQQQQNLAVGDTVGAALWASAAASHQQDAREIRARIATASAPPDNSASIAAYQGALAGYIADYFALTGVKLG